MPFVLKALVLSLFSFFVLSGCEEKSYPGSTGGPVSLDAQANKSNFPNLPLLYQVKKQKSHAENAEIVPSSSLLYFYSGSSLKPFLDPDTYQESNDLNYRIKFNCSNESNTYEGRWSEDKTARLISLEAHLPSDMLLQDLQSSFACEFSFQDLNAQVTEIHDIEVILDSPRAKFEVFSRAGDRLDLHVNELEGYVLPEMRFDQGSLQLLCEHSQFKELTVGGVLKKSEFLDFWARYWSEPSSMPLKKCRFLYNRTFLTKLSRIFTLHTEYQFEYSSRLQLEKNLFVWPSHLTSGGKVNTYEADAFSFQIRNLGAIDLALLVPKSETLSAQYSVGVGFTSYHNLDIAYLSHTALQKIEPSSDFFKFEREGFLVFQIPAGQGIKVFFDMKYNANCTGQLFRIQKFVSQVMIFSGLLGYVAHYDENMSFHTNYYKDVEMERSVFQSDARRVIDVDKLTPTNRPMMVYWSCQ